MTKLRYLSVLMSQRLTLAAQEIFKDVEEAMLELQEEAKQAKQENATLKLRLREVGFHGGEGVRALLSPGGVGISHDQECDDLEEARQVEATIASLKQELDELGEYESLSMDTGRCSRSSESTALQIKMELDFTDCLSPERRPVDHTSQSNNTAIQADPIGATGLGGETLTAQRQPSRPEVFPCVQRTWSVATAGDDEAELGSSTAPEIRESNKNCGQTPDEDLNEDDFCEAENDERCQGQSPTLVEHSEDIPSEHSSQKSSANKDTVGTRGRQNQSNVKQSQTLETPSSLRNSKLPTRSSSRISLRAGNELPSKDKASKQSISSSSESDNRNIEDKSETDKTVGRPQNNPELSNEERHSLSRQNNQENQSRGSNDTVDKTVTPKISKKIGRPRKHPILPNETPSTAKENTQGEPASSSVDNKDSPVIKKKIGRPRKHLQISTVNYENSSSTDSILTEKSTGRPSKRLRTSSPDHDEISIDDQRDCPESKDESTLAEDSTYTRQNVMLEKRVGSVQTDKDRITEKLVDDASITGEESNSAVQRINIRLDKHAVTLTTSPNHKFDTEEEESGASKEPTNPVRTGKLRGRPRKETQAPTVQPNKGNAENEKRDLGDGNEDAKESQTVVKRKGRPRKHPQNPIPKPAEMDLDQSECVSENVSITKFCQDSVLEEPNTPADSQICAGTVTADNLQHCQSEDTGDFKNNQKCASTDPVIPESNVSSLFEEPVFTQDDGNIAEMRVALPEAQAVCTSVNQASSEEGDYALEGPVISVDKENCSLPELASSVDGQISAREERADSERSQGSIVDYPSHNEDPLHCESKDPVLPVQYQDSASEKFDFLEDGCSFISDTAFLGDDQSEMSADVAYDNNDQSNGSAFSVTPKEGLGGVYANPLEVPVDTKDQDCDSKGQDNNVPCALGGLVEDDCTTVVDRNEGEGMASEGPDDEGDALEDPVEGVEDYKATVDGQAVSEDLQTLPRSKTLSMFLRNTSGPSNTQLAQPNQYTSSSDDASSDDDDDGGGGVSSGRSKRLSRKRHHSSSSEYEVDPEDEEDKSYTEEDDSDSDSPQDSQKKVNHRKSSSMKKIAALEQSQDSLFLLTHKKAVSKQNYCLYCLKPCTKISRHLANRHYDEPDVVKALSLPKKSKERKVQFGRILKRGNRVHNNQVMSEGKGLVCTARASMNFNLEELKYCPGCHGMYKYIDKHISNCPLVTKQNLQVRKIPRRRPPLRPLVSEVSEEFLKVLNGMFQDDVTEVVEQDKDLLKLGQFLYNQNQSTERIWQTLRELGRLLLNGKQLTPLTQINEFVRTFNWAHLVTAVKDVTRYCDRTRTFPFSNYQKHLQRSLKQVASIIKRDADSAGDCETAEDIQKFIETLKMRWYYQFLSEKEDMSSILDLDTGKKESTDGVTEVDERKRKAEEREILQMEIYSSENSKTQDHQRHAVANIANRGTGDILVGDGVGTTSRTDGEADPTPVGSEGASAAMDYGMGTAPLVEQCKDVTIRADGGARPFASPSQAEAGFTEWTDRRDVGLTVSPSKGDGGLSASTIRGNADDIATTDRGDEHLPTSLVGALTALTDGVASGIAAFTDRDAAGFTVSTTQDNTVFAAPNDVITDTMSGITPKPVSCEDTAMISVQSTPVAADRVVTAILTPNCEGGTKVGVACEENSDAADDTDWEDADSNYNDDADDDDSSCEGGRDLASELKVKMPEDPFETNSMAMLCCSDPAATNVTAQTPDGSALSVVSQQGDNSELKTATSLSASLTAVDDGSNQSDATSRLKKVYCFICKQYVAKLSKHLEARHYEHAEVAEALSHPKGTKERKRLLQLYVTRGRRIHNTQVLKEGKGKLQGHGRQGALSPSEALTCPFCDGIFAKGKINMHVRRCPSATEEDLAKLKLGPRRSIRLLTAQSEQIPDYISKDLWQLLVMMNQDEIALAVKGDKHALLMAQELMDKRPGEEPIGAEYIRQRLRELGRLLVNCRKSTPMYKVEDFILPTNWEHVVAVIKDVAGYKKETESFAKVTILLHLYRTFQKIARIVECDAMSRQDEKLVACAKEFQQGFIERWKQHFPTPYQNRSSHDSPSAAGVESGEVSSPRKTQKQDGVRLLSFTEDIHTVHTFLRDKQNEYSVTLSRSPNPDAWHNLARVALAQLILFNRRKPEEIAQLTVKDFGSKEAYGIPDGDTEDLTLFERELCRLTCRITVSTTTGENIQILIPPSLAHTIDILLQWRLLGEIRYDNIYVFSLAKSRTFFSGEEVLSGLAKESGIKNVKELVSNGLRQHIAVISRLLYLKELPQVTEFMGLNLSTHLRNDCLQQETMGLARLGKVFLITESGEQGQPAQLLEQITVTPDELVQQEQPSSSDEDENDDEYLPSKFRQSKVTARAKTRTSTTKHRWTEAEVKAVENHMAKFISSGTTPGKKACTACLLAEPEALKARSWTAIKFYTKNRITSLRRRSAKPPQS